MVKENRESTGRDHENCQFSGFHQILWPVLFQCLNHELKWSRSYQLDSGVIQGSSQIPCPQRHQGSVPIRLKM